MAEGAEIGDGWIDGWEQSALCLYLYRSLAVLQGLSCQARDLLGLSCGPLMRGNCWREIARIGWTIAIPCPASNSGHGQRVPKDFSKTWCKPLQIWEHQKMIKWNNMAESWSCATPRWKYSVFLYTKSMYRCGSNELFDLLAYCQCWNLLTQNLMSFQKRYSSSSKRFKPEREIDLWNCVACTRAKIGAFWHDYLCLFVFHFLICRIIK